MSSYSERFGNHLIDSSCARQSVIALSSGEAEFYALTRGAASGMMSKQVWNPIGYESVGLKLKTDSTAAKGIATRKGVGKVKHLSLKELWIQDYLQRGEFKVEKESTVTNWADLNTKSLSGPRITELLSYMPIKRACLLSCLMIVGAQNADNEEAEGDGPPSFIFSILWNFLAIYGLLILVWRNICQKRRKTRDQGSQTEHNPVATVFRRRRYDETEETVYVVGKGTKFHTKECVYIAGSRLNSRLTQMYRRQAIHEGLTACKTCMSVSSSSG